MSPASLLILLACTTTSTDDSGGDGGSTNTQPACWTDLAAGQVQTLADGFSEGTEGLAFADGRLFVGTPTDVVELSADGQATTLWVNDHVLGLAAAKDRLWVADPGEFSFGGDSDGEIWSLSLEGQATLHLDGLSNPNFLAPTPWGTLLLSDDTEERVDELDSDGLIGTWIDGVVSPNGMVATEDHVTIASTFSAAAEVWQVPVLSSGEGDHRAGELELLATTSEGGANDGMAGSPEGSVWVAVNLAGEIWRITAGGEASRFVSGLDSPASLAFGEGDDFDPCSLYVSSLFGDRVVRVAVGEDAR